MLLVLLLFRLFHGLSQVCVAPLRTLSRLKLVSRDQLLIRCLALVSCLATVGSLFLNLLDSVVGEQFLIPDVLSNEESRAFSRVLIVCLFGFGA